MATTTATAPLRERTASPLSVPAINTTNLQDHPNVNLDLPSVARSGPQEAASSEGGQRRVTLSDTAAENPSPPQYQQGGRLLKAPPKISITSSRSVSNMHRAFSMRRSKSGAKTTTETNGNKTQPPAMHSRNHSMTYGDKTNGLSPQQNGGGLSRSMSKREKFVRAITNPDTIFNRDPASPPPESRFNPNPNSKLARTFFGNGRVDFGSGVPLAPPTPPTPLPDADLPLFNPGLISDKVLSELPSGYTMRPLCRGDYHRGYMEVLRVVGRTGWVGEDVWEERCEWLRTQASTYYILVVVNTEDRVVASGTVMLERKFIHNMGVVGHIEDLAVARDQKGKKMGLRILEALVHIANCHGSYKTIVNCTEANEAFHAQTGFCREGSQMVLHHNRRAPEHWV